MSDENVFKSDADGGRIPEKFGMARVDKEGGLRRLMPDGSATPPPPGRTLTELSSDLLASFSATMAASKCWFRARVKTGSGTEDMQNQYLCFPTVQRPTFTKICFEYGSHRMRIQISRIALRQIVVGTWGDIDIC
jgi:hypothetical protein